MDSKAQPLPSIGFVIMSHAHGPQLARLVATLNREFAAPPIACHHDFGQAQLDQNLPPNVRIVRPHRRTGWARWSVVAGALDALALLYADGGPDWFFLLSAADYPSRTGDQIRSELAASNCDAYIDLRPLDPHDQPRAQIIGDGNAKLSHFDSAGNRAMKKRFYCAPQFWLPIVRLKPRFRIGRYTYRPPLEGRHPFRNGRACWYGDHWFTANRKVAEVILEQSDWNVALRRHFRTRTQPDEAYYQTLLANTAGLVLCRDNRRYAEWHGGGAHPIELSPYEIGDATASNAFFARKFGPISPAIAELDEVLAARGQIAQRSIGQGRDRS